MKRVIFLTLLIELSFLCYGQEFEREGIYYKVCGENNDQVEIINCDRGLSLTSEDMAPILVIPELVEYEGMEYEVVRILPYVFKDYRVSKKVVIPNTMQEIGHYAFQDSWIEELEIYGTRDLEIKHEAFSGCKKLKSVKIGHLGEEDWPINVERTCSGPYWHYTLFRDSYIKKLEIFRPCVQSTWNQYNIVAYAADHERPEPNPGPFWEACVKELVYYPSACAISWLSFSETAYGFEKVTIEGGGTYERIWWPETLRYIICKSPEPPPVLKRYYPFNRSNIILLVPKESKDLYRADEYWGKFPNIIYEGESWTQVSLSSFDNDIEIRGLTLSIGDNVKEFQIISIDGCIVASGRGGETVNVEKPGFYIIAIDGNTQKVLLK